MKPSPGSPDALFARNRWTFSVGTLGRDMVYALVSLYLIFFLTEVLNASDAFMWWAGWLILAARLFEPPRVLTCFSSNVAFSAFGQSTPGGSGRWLWT